MKMKPKHIVPLLAAIMTATATAQTTPPTLIGGSGGSFGVIAPQPVRLFVFEQWYAGFGWWECGRAWLTQAEADARLAAVNSVRFGGQTGRPILRARIIR